MSPGDVDPTPRWTRPPSEADRAGCFFSRERTTEGERGRLLLISYHFPPGRAAGALRWQKLARHAHERGWELDVFCLDPASLAASDRARLDDLPPGTRVFGVAAEPTWMERLEAWLHTRLRRLANGSGRASHPVEAGTASARSARVGSRRPTSFARSEVRFRPFEARSWIRAYASVLELSTGAAWTRRALSQARAILDPDVHRLVVTCGPPHAVHEAGRRLARETGLPWVMDLRDPWSQAERLPESLGSPIHYTLARRGERRCVRAARLIVMNTEPARDVMRTLYPERAADVIAVPNAFDEDPAPAVERSTRFVIAYAGTIYLDRTPETLFRAAARVVRELGIGPDELGVEFMGYVGALDGTSLERLARDAGLEAYVRHHPASDYQVAERFLAGAGMLVSLPQDSHLAIPSKVYDYMRFPARLLVLAEPGSATERLLRETTAHVVDPQDEAGIAEAIREALLEFRAGRTPAPIAEDARFSRRSRARELFDAIDARITSG